MQCYSQNGHKNLYFDENEISKEKEQLAFYKTILRSSMSVRICIFECISVVENKFEDQYYDLHGRLPVCTDVMSNNRVRGQATQGGTGNSNATRGRFLQIRAFRRPNPPIREKNIPK